MGFLSFHFLNFSCFGISDGCRWVLGICWHGQWEVPVEESEGEVSWGCEELLEFSDPKRPHLIFLCILPILLCVFMYNEVDMGAVHFELFCKCKMYISNATNISLWWIPNLGSSSFKRLCIHQIKHFTSIWNRFGYAKKFKSSLRINLEDEAIAVIFQG